MTIFERQEASYGQNKYDLFNANDVLNNICSLSYDVEKSRQYFPKKNLKKPLIIFRATDHLKMGRGEVVTDT